MQYAITIVRFDGDDEQTEIVDRYVTADQAIDLIIAVNSLPEDEEDEEDEVEEEQEAEPEIVDEPEPAPKKSPGKRTSFNVNEVIDAFDAGELSVQEIAAQQGVKYNVIWNAKKKYDAGTLARTDGSSGPMQEPVDPGETAYQARKREKEATPKPTIEEQARDMAMQGLSFMELEFAFPSVPVYKLREIYDSCNQE